MKRLLPALAMAALIHAVLFTVGARWLTGPNAIAPRTHVITMQLVDVTPPPQTAMHTLPTSPPPLPPAPKKPIVEKPAPKPKPVAKKSKPVKKPPPPKKAPVPLAPEPAPQPTDQQIQPQPVRPAPAAETAPATASGKAVSRSTPQDSDHAPGETTTAAASVVMATPRYSENPPPRYPTIARKRGYQGTVVLDVLVKADGQVGDLRIVESSTHTLLDRAAASAVKAWQFEPGRHGDRVVAMWVRVPVRFALN
ncbi:MAG: energy transducer TonB [Desulfosarcina sp.]